MRLRGERWRGVPRAEIDRQRVGETGGHGHGIPYRCAERKAARIEIEAACAIAAVGGRRVEHIELLIRSPRGRLVKYGRGAAECGAAIARAPGEVVDGLERTVLDEVHKIDRRYRVGDVQGEGEYGNEKERQGAGGAGVRGGTHKCPRCRGCVRLKMDMLIDPHPVSSE